MDELFSKMFYHEFLPPLASFSLVQTPGVIKHIHVCPYVQNIVKSLDISWNIILNMPNLISKIET